MLFLIFKYRAVIVPRGNSVGIREMSYEILDLQGYKLLQLVSMLSLDIMARHQFRGLFGRMIWPYDFARWTSLV
jgi:hypothetical protein